MMGSPAQGRLSQSRCLSRKHLPYPIAFGPIEDGIAFAVFERRI